MLNYKKVGTIVLFVLILGFGFWLIFQSKRNNQSALPTVKTSSVLLRTPSTAVKGERLVSLSEFTPPYTLKALGIRAGFDQSNIIDVVEALWDIPDTNRDAYLALMDEGVRQRYEAAHPVSGNSEADKVPNDFPVTVLTHWVDMEYAGKSYRIVVGKMLDKDGSTQIHLNFENRNGKWVQTLALDPSSLEFFVGQTPLEELKKQVAL